MLPAPSFVTANLVARPLGYRMDKGWSQGDQASNDWFAPLATFVALVQLMDNFRVFEPIVGFSAEANATSLSWLVFNDLVSADSQQFGSAAATSGRRVSSSEGNPGVTGGSFDPAAANAIIADMRREAGAVVRAGAGTAPRPPACTTRSSRLRNPHSRHSSARASVSGACRAAASQGIASGTAASRKT